MNSGLEEPAFPTLPLSFRGDMRYIYIYTQRRYNRHTGHICPDLRSMQPLMLFLMG